MNFVPELHPKKSAAQKIFGSHLFLQNKKIDFTPQTQWAALSAARVLAQKEPSCFEMESLDSEARTYFISNC